MHDSTITYVKSQSYPDHPTTPAKPSAHNAAHDLYSVERCIVKACSWKVVNTGITMNIPAGYCGQICCRYLLAAKYGIAVNSTIIDKESKREIRVVLQNQSQVDYQVRIGDPIAKFLLLPVSQCTFRELVEN